MRENNKKSIGFVGFGKRVENVYLPIINKLSDHFEISGFSTRRKNRESQIINDYGLEPFENEIEVCNNSDFHQI